MQSDRQDKSAVGWDNVETVEKHQSQVDHSKVSYFSEIYYFIIFNYNYIIKLFNL